MSPTNPFLNGDLPPLEEENDDGELEPLRDLPPFRYYLVKQDVELDVNFRERCVTGYTKLYIHATSDDKLEEIAIDARQTEIDVDNIVIETIRNGVSSGPPKKAPATYLDPYRLLEYPNLYRWNAEHHDLRKLRMRPLMHTRKNDAPANDRVNRGTTPVDGALRVKLGLQKRPTLVIRKSTINEPSDDYVWIIGIPFKTRHIRDGLQFVGVDIGDTRYPHAYTRHSFEPGTACCIFPCLDDHGARGDWKVSIKFPRTLSDVLQQPLATKQPQGSHGSRPTNGAGASGNHNNETSEDTVECLLTEEDKMLEMTAVCSGLLTDEIVDPNDDRKKIMTFESERDVSVQQVGFAVGPFEHVNLWSQFRTEEDDEKLGVNALKIHGYCLPRRADEVRNTCAVMAAAADYLSLTFSGYPFDSYKLCFVDDMVQDSVPLYSLSFVSNRLLYPPDVIDTEIDVTRELVFNIAMQWSGVSIIPDTRRDRWVTIGIAYFMADLFMRKICGNNEHRFRTKTAADRLVKEDIRRPSLYELGHYLHLGEFEVDFMKLKAPLVLFILDKRLAKASGGASGLPRILSRLFTKAMIDRGGVISTDGFRKMCEKMGKQNLESFWHQWVYGAGCPRFEVTPRFNKKRLCVEMTVKQVQSQFNDGPQLMEKDTFLRAIKEAQYKVEPGTIQQIFTGPMTIRIHEADGTPYEHIVEIRDDSVAKRTSRFEIPYNTKYKRLKRTRRQKERAVAGAAGDGENAEESLLYSLGDSLQAPEDVERFMLVEWDEETERRMDGESYEWIRMDSDFEWLCSMKTNVPSYMYVSQLQQDRDVVAQQETMVYIGKERAHPVASTILVRTLMDCRYYYGIRIMAADLLHLQAIDQNDMQIRGLVQLEEAFKQFFCNPGTGHPRPNNFEDKRQYFAQKAIPLSMAQIRDSRGKCPLRARMFILDQLVVNDNSENMYSDHYYIANLITALATSLIPDQKQSTAIFMNSIEDDDSQSEEKKFLAQALEEIDRYLRLDEWTNSYRNIWTITALDAKQKLMKAEVIPLQAIDFLQYLQDQTYDEVRIKAFEALVDLGFLSEPTIFRFLLCCMSTDRSPYVRDRLLKAFCHGLAGIAFGEYAKPIPRSAAKNPDEEGDEDMGLIVVDDAAEIEARKKEIARKQNLPDAMAALKREMELTYSEMESDLQQAVWKAIDSPVLGRAEKITLLELCATMFDEADRWIITLNYPKKWRVTRALQRRQGQLIMNFKSYYRTEPLRPDGAPLLQHSTPTEVVRKPVIVSRTSSLPKIIKPPAQPSRASIAVSTPRHGDSITAQSSVYSPPGTSVADVPTPLSGSTPIVKAAKRPREKGDSESTPIPKKIKVDTKPPSSSRSVSAKPSRIVKLRGPSVRRAMQAAGTIATPIRSASNSGVKPERRPLPDLDSGDRQPSIQDPSPNLTKPIRKPLPSGPSISPTTPHISLMSATSGRTPLPASSPPPSDKVNNAAPARPRIKITIKRPPPPPAP